MATNQSQMSNQQRQLQNYSRSLLNPFLTTVPQPKIYDGKTLRSAGVRFRSTGELSVYSGITYIVLAPALTKPLTWYGNDEGGTWIVNIPTDTTEHINTSTQRAQIDKIRLVGMGLKLNLMNSADQNEGYWEAARFSTNISDFDLVGTIDGRTRHRDLQLALPIELSNEPSYQRGKLKDIHKFMFRLNSNNTEHNFGRMSETETLNQLIDEDWDSIIIKVHGRVEVGSPSVLNYEVINNQEVIYRTGTSIARLMTPSPFIPQTPRIMGAVKMGLPGLRIEA
jgi:hypothetical protein